MFWLSQQKLCASEMELELSVIMNFGGNNEIHASHFCCSSSAWTLNLARERLTWCRRKGHTLWCGVQRFSGNDVYKIQARDLATRAHACVDVIQFCLFLPEERCIWSAVWKHANGNWLVEGWKLRHALAHDGGSHDVDSGHAMRLCTHCRRRTSKRPLTSNNLHVMLHIGLRARC